jgi:hypothetical protein
MIEYKPDDVSYTSLPVPPNAKRNFLSGPGESLALQSISLKFDGVIKVEGSLLR